MSPSMWACFLDHLEHLKLLNNINGDVLGNAADRLLFQNDAKETDNDGRTWVHWSVRKTDPLKCLKVKNLLNLKIVFFFNLIFF